jgi:hypothetical protein
MEPGRDEHADEDLKDAAFPTESERARRAITLGTALGLALALMARARRG